MINVTKGKSYLQVLWLHLNQRAGQGSPKEVTKVEERKQYLGRRAGDIILRPQSLGPACFSLHIPVPLHLEKLKIQNAEACLESWIYNVSSL